VLDLAALRQEQIGDLVALDSPVQAQLAGPVGLAAQPQAAVALLFGMAALRQRQEQLAGLVGVAAHSNHYSLRP